MHSEQKLSTGVKLAYGVGLAAEGIKNNAFHTFLLFFYQQLVGLDSALCGIALFVALCADAVLDPVIGSWSDGLRSRLGRRHPFMYASILPMTIAYVLVFMPPAGLGQAGKFMWLVSFAIITRVAMAMFVIPHQSLVPQLSSDSGERATLTNLRVVSAWIFGLINSLVAYTVFLKASPGQPQGLLNASGYRPFALFGALVMLAAMLTSALGTQRAAIARKATAAATHISVRELPMAIRDALRTPSFRAVVFAGLFLFVGFGVVENLNNYMNTFFWGFSSKQIGAFIIVIFAASMAVLSCARLLLTRFGSRKVGMGCALVIASAPPTAIALRLLGFMPEMGAPRLFACLCVSTFFFYGAIMLGMTVVGKMIADVSDEYELLTGARQEGLLFSANMFMMKAATGFGTLGSGLIIKASRFPENATLAIVDPTAVRNLGIGAAVAGLAFGLLTFYFYNRFRLTHQQHHAIVTQLAQRRAAVPSEAPVDASIGALVGKPVEG